MNLLLAYLFLFPLQKDAALSHWLDGPVSVIVSEVERKTFSQLKSDAEREQFIDRFWSLRDPNPGSRINEFKQEFERRVAKADEQFGGLTSSEGWRSERGRYYLLLGEPKSRAQFKTQNELRPIELWFYSGSKQYPQIPPFFYLLFYQRDEVGDYRHYSPFLDGPQKLVRKQTRDAGDAYRVMNGINSDLARASLSLVPGEPIDTTGLSPSMASDAVLAQINQIPKRDFENANTLRESVNVKLKYNAAAMTLYPILTGTDVFTVDLAIDRPTGLADAKVETVISRDGKEQGRTRAEFAKDDPMVGRLILKSGEYVVEASITSGDGKQSYTARDVLHLKTTKAPLSLGEILFFRSASAAKPGAPFTYFGYRFAADVRRQFHPADKLQVLFQIAAPDAADSGKKLAIDYTIAAVNNAANRWTFHDDVGVERLDANGLLLNSKTLSIRELAPGRYFLVIMATDPAGHRASQTVSFEVTETSDPS